MQKALASLPGVADVKTDVESRTATFVAETKEFDEEKAKQVLKEAGYEVKSVQRKSL